MKQNFDSHLGTGKLENVSIKSMNICWIWSMQDCMDILATSCTSIKILGHKMIEALHAREHHKTKRYRYL